MFMDREFIEQTVFSAARDVFSTMLGMEAVRIPELCETNRSDDRERVVALIGIAGNYIGTGMIGCSPKLACQAAGTMMMAEYAAVDVEVLDTLGEIANMIFGNVKSELEGKVGELGLSIPTVVFGRNFSTRSTGQQDWVNVPMRAGEEEIELRFCVAPNQAVLRHGKHVVKKESVFTGV